MEAEIIAVGTELLLGDILNTNAQFLSRELAALGITVHFQTVVGDNPARLESVVRQARGRSDLLVFSGGLGPTEDDLTKQTVARAFGDTLRFDEAELEKIRAFFTAWGRTMPENNKKQAMVPTHGRKIPNANGTAPGMIFEDQAAPGKYAVLLPGPPKELQPMFLKPTYAELYDHFKTIAESVPETPVLLYNNPGRVGYTLSAQLVEELAHTVPNIVGMKDTSGDITQTSEFIRRTRDVEFKVFGGKDTLLYASLCHGAVGGVCTAANFMPELITDVYNKYAAGNLAGSLEAQFKLNPVRLSMDAASFPVAAKDMANLRGRKVGVPYLPTLPTPEGAAKQGFVKTMTEAGLL